MRKILVALTALLLSAQAHAGIYIEPYLGYEMGTYKGSGINKEIDGSGYGLRLGYSVPMLVLGLEYGMGTLSWEAKNDSTDTGKYEYKDLGAFVQVNLPILLSARLGYVFDTQMDVKGGTDKREGTGIKAGLAFRFIPFLHVNLDYITYNYDKLNSNTTIDTDRSTLMLGLGLPVNL
jgi:hypothetical protein